VWLIGAVVCLLAAHIESSYLQARATDSRTAEVKVKGAIPQLGRRRGAHLPFLGL